MKPPQKTCHGEFILYLLIFFREKNRFFIVENGNKWKGKQFQEKLFLGIKFSRISKNIQKRTKKKKKFKSFFLHFFKGETFSYETKCNSFFFLNRCFFWNQVGKKFCRFRFFRFIFHIFISFILSAIALIRYLLRYSARCDRSTRSTKYLLYIHVNIRIIYSNTSTFIARISLLTYGLLGFWVK